MDSKFQRFIYLISLIIVVVGGIGGSIWMVIYGVTSDDVELNILTWIIIVICGGIFITPVFLNFSEWLKKKKILNKNQAYWFSLIPLTPLLVGKFIFLIGLVIGILYYLFRLG